MDAHVVRTWPVESRITLRTDDHCPGDAPRAGTTEELVQVQVKIDDVGFSPAHVEVPRGTTVAWVNGGIMPHQITGAHLTFEDSNLLRTGESASRTFTAPGTYTYLCGPHQGI